MWDAAQYARFSDDRSRPFFDLVAQVHHPDPRNIVDLGCGNGPLTRSLADRWPAARVVGIDSSPEMLVAAAGCAIPGRLDFIQGLIEDWSPTEPVDVIISNAALHWVPDHPALLPRLCAALAPGGVLAVQMPTRFTTSSQRAIEETVADPRWSAQLAGIGLHRESVMPADRYFDILRGLGLSANIWQTTYLHVLTGDNAVLEWLKGTALRPLLAALPDAERPEFLDELNRRLLAEYPPRGEVTLFPFPRLFFVAARGA